MASIIIATATTKKTEKKQFIFPNPLTGTPIIGWLQEIERTPI